MNETPATVRMIDGATTPAISNVFVNNACAVCTLQITGSFTAATVLVEGIVNVASNQWVTLAAFNLSDLSLEKDGADKAGIYQVGIEGILRVRMNVTEVSGGDITIAAQFGNATINQFSKTEASNLIPITAYDMAVAGGYTGTLEQFEEDMGNSGTNAANAAASASAAAASASAAAASAGSVSASAAQIATNTSDISDLKESRDDLWTQLGETVSVKYENEISCSINVNTGELTNNSKATTVYLRCLPNKIYIVRKNAGGRFAVGDTTDIPASGIICNAKTTNNAASEIVYKTSSEARYLVAFVYFSDTDGDKNTMLSSVDIRYYSAYDIVARNQIDAMYGRLIDVFRNTAFINASGESVLKRFADEIGVKGWLDVIGSYTINSSTGNIAPTDQNYRAVSSWFDVGSGTAITSEFTDWQNPEMKYAIYCYDNSKTYISRGSPTGAQSGTTKITFPANTRYIRFMFVDSSVSNIVDKITGRIVRFVLTDNSSNPEIVYCLTKTEDLNNVI